MSITFGYGGTYDWTPFHWSTLTNVQYTNTTDFTTGDGWVVLAFAAPTTQTAWDNLTGWTEEGGGGTGADSLIDPAGQLYQWSTSVDTRTNIYDVDWANGGVASNTYCFFHFLKFSGLSQSTVTNTYAGWRQSHDTGSRSFHADIRSDGTYFDIYSGYGVTYTKYDTTFPISTSRCHIFGFYNNNADNASVAVISGVEVATGMATAATFGLPGYTELFEIKRTGDGDVGHHTAWTKYWNVATPWETTDGVMESDTSDAIYDAGAYNWKKIVWTADTSNGTALTVEARTAATAAGLATAVYFAVTSGTDFAAGDQKEFIQVRITLSDAGSGRYTPILKTMELWDTQTPIVADESFYDSILVKGQLTLGSFVGKDGDSKSQEGQTDSVGNLVIKCY